MKNNNCNFAPQSTFNISINMKTSRARFVILFLFGAFAFQFITNSILGSEVRLFPMNSDPFPGSESLIVWKNVLEIIIYPIKVMLLGPLLGLFKLPDPPPPMVVIPFAIYWSIIALVLHFLISKIKTEKKKKR